MSAAPHEFTPGQLHKAGVRVISHAPLRLKCKHCAAVWPVSQRRLRLPKGYWKCPNRCNAVG